MEYMLYHTVTSLPYAIMLCGLSSLGWGFGKRYGWLIAPALLFCFISLGMYYEGYSSSPGDAFLSAWLLVLPSFLVFILTVDGQLDDIWEKVGSYGAQHPFMLHLYLAATQLLLLSVVSVLILLFKDNSPRLLSLNGWLLVWSIIILAVAAAASKLDMVRIIARQRKSLADRLTPVAQIYPERQEATLSSTGVGSSGPSKMEEWLKRSEQIEALRSKGLIDETDFERIMSALKQEIAEGNLSSRQNAADLNTANAGDETPEVQIVYAAGLSGSQSVVPEAEPRAEPPADPEILKASDVVPEALPGQTQKSGMQFGSQAKGLLIALLVSFLIGGMAVFVVDAWMAKEQPNVSAVDTGVETSAQPSRSIQSTPTLETRIMVVAQVEPLGPEWGNLSTLVKTGMSVKALRVSDTSGTWKLLPGDRVDLYYTAHDGSLNGLLYESVRVLATNENKGSVVIEMSPVDAENLALIKNMNAGDVTLNYHTVATVDTVVPSAPVETSTIVVA